MWKKLVVPVQNCEGKGAAQALLSHSIPCSCQPLLSCPPSTKLCFLLDHSCANLKSLQVPPVFTVLIVCKMLSSLLLAATFP